MIASVANGRTGTIVWNAATQRETVFLSQRDPMCLQPEARQFPLWVKGGEVYLNRPTNRI